MLTLHISSTEKTVILPKEEFTRLIENYKKFDSIDITEDYQPDYLTEGELEQLAIAEEELRNGETISLEEFIKRENLDVRS